jgi:tetratricopeptide (TPR) repeat protein
MDPRLLATSVEALEEAVRMDASFVIAWAHLSIALEWSQRLTADQGERAGLQRRAADAAERALDSDQGLPEALYAMAFQGSRAPGAPLRVENDIGLLERALAARPNGAGILRELGLRYELLGEIDEAARYADQAAELEPRSALFQARASTYSRLLRDFDESDRRLRLAASLSSDAPLAAALLVRERLSLELARGGGLARAAEIFREEEPRLTRSRMLEILGDFPELMASGEFEAMVLSLSPSASDPELRCTCYRLKAWAHDVADRPDVARVYWDSLSAEGSARATSLWELPNSDRDRFREAQVLARAGRTEAAAALLQEDRAPGAGDRHDTRYQRAAAYAALGDVESAVQELRGLLSVPSEVTTASLRDRIIWDSIRDRPSFRALLGG